MECDRRGDGFGSKAMHQVQCEVHQIHHTARQLRCTTPRCWPCHASKWDPVPTSPVSLHLPGGIWPLLVVLSSTLQDMKKASKMAHQGLSEYLSSFTCPSPFHTFVMPARLNPVLAQGAWRVANVAEKVEGAGEGMWCQAEQQGTTSLFSSPCHGWQAAICTLSSPGSQCMGGGCRCASPGRRHT